MRIIHLADTHLGFRQFPGRLDPERGLNQRECDVYDAWHRAIDIAIERDVDAVVHAGDLFDSPRPTMRAVSEALDGLGRLRDAGIPVVAIAGNHSTPRYRSAGSVFQVLQRFGMHAAWERPERFDLGGVAFHAVPHEPDPQELRATIEGLEPDPDADANVLILHAGLEAVPRSSYGEVNAVELGQDVLAGVSFDYIALGHLHRFQVPQVNAIYPGSLERLDFADVEGEKTVLEIDLAAGPGANGFVTRHPIPTRPVIDVEVECSECDPDEVLARLRAQLDGRALDGAVVRVRFHALQRDVFHALDAVQIDDLFSACLHHSVQVGPGGLLSVTADDDGRELKFDSFARERVPSGLDAERVIAIAHGFLDDALTEEHEQGVAT